MGIGTGNFLASIVDNDKFKFSYIFNENESYFTLSVNDYYFYSGIGMNTSGQIDMFIVGLMDLQLCGPNHPVMTKKNKGPRVV